MLARSWHMVVVFSGEVVMVWSVVAAVVGSSMMLLLQFAVAMLGYNGVLHSGSRVMEARCCIGFYYDGGAYSTTQSILVKLNEVDYGIHG